MDPRNRMDPRDRALIAIAHEASAAVDPRGEGVWSGHSGLFGIANAIARSGHAPVLDVLRHMARTARALLKRQDGHPDRTEMLDERTIEALRKFLEVADPRNDTAVSSLG